MIDPSAPAASWFLWILPPFFLVVFGLPLFLAPFAWARVFRWRTNPDDDLALYFGRCLGAVAIGVAGVCWRVASAPRAHPEVLELVAGAGALLTIVHVRGALEKRQPWTETVEIVMYGALAVVAGVLRAGL